MTRTSPMAALAVGGTTSAPLALAARYRSVAEAVPAVQRSPAQNPITEPRVMRGLQVRGMKVACPGTILRDPGKAAPPMPERSARLRGGVTARRSSLLLVLLLAALDP